MFLKFFIFTKTCRKYLVLIFFPSDLALDDASAEFASKPVVLQPYLHPEVSSIGACCIMIRLSTQRLLRIVQLVLISSSPHIDFVDRYGEPLARIEGVLVPDSEEELYRCSSGRLSPHTECVVRVSSIIFDFHSSMFVEFKCLIFVKCIPFK